VFEDLYSVNFVDLFSFLLASQVYRIVCYSFSQFWFCFFSSRQEIGWDVHPWNDIFCVVWDIIP